MKHTRSLTLALCGCLGVAPLVAQGIPRGARVARSANTAPRLMVANPYVVGPDSTAAVQVGGAIRLNMQDMVGGDYVVITREQMNEALQTYDFPPDAILNNSSAVDLAKLGLGVRVLVTGTLSKTSNGQFVVSERVVGMSDEAGNVVTLTRQPAERLPDFGQRIATGLEPALKTLKDAQACLAERESGNIEKAVKAADKAIKKLPDHGLAHFCLYLIAKQQKATPNDAVQHLEAAVKGDPGSLVAWRALANEYQAMNDTANVLRVAKQLLRLAPNDQEQRERILQYFLQANQPQLALEVADEGLQADPQNADLYDLKGNACLLQRNFPCALEALEMRYTLDSTKADTLFFAKIVGTAAEAPDTARLVKWSELGVRKYPDNVTLLRYLNQGYAWTGQVDSSLAVTQRLMAKDTGAVRPALAAVVLLAKDDRMAMAPPYVAYVKQRGDAAAKDQLAAILISVASVKLQGDSATGKPRDPAAAAEIGRLIVDVPDTASERASLGNFILGAALVQQVVEIDSTANQKKSCELARQEQALLAEAKTALTKAARSVSLQSKAEQYLGYVKQYDTSVAKSLKAYC